MAPDSSQTLTGRRIAITAERRSTEQADLFRRRGAQVIHAPVLHTVDLVDDAALRAATDAFVAAPPDWFLATTGYGVRLWLQAAEGWDLREAVIDALGQVPHVVARGAKSRSALTQAGIPPEWTAPSEAMPEVLDYVGRAGLNGRRVAVQLFDPDEHPSTVALRAQVGEAGSVLELPVYRWELPSDLAPAHDLVEAVLAGQVDAVTFTSQPAVRHLFRIARERRGPAAPGDLAERFNSTVWPVCIGPVCAEAGLELGLHADRLRYPESNRLVPMVKLVEALLVDGASTKVVP